MWRPLWSSLWSPCITVDGIHVGPVGAGPRPKCKILVNCWVKVHIGLHIRLHIRLHIGST